MRYVASGATIMGHMKSLKKPNILVLAFLKEVISSSELETNPMIIKK